MKLLIQIPCKNEEGTLPSVLAELPTSVPGITHIETLVIDDGSTDATVQVAKNLWVTHVLTFAANRGLWDAFRAGMVFALQQWADILVNTDADNQYPGTYIADLVAPLVAGQADIAIGDRRPGQVAHFRWYKKMLQRFGNVVMQFFTWVYMPDAVSWFRAYNKEALEMLNVTVRFSYVIDTILQAYQKGLAISRVPITTNAPTRPSRLFKNIWVHIQKSAVSILRVYTMYAPFRIFLLASIPFLLIGLGGVLRFLRRYRVIGEGSGKVQSLIIASVLIMIGMNFISLGIIGDVIARNRMLIEEHLRLTKKFLIPQNKEHA
jgi:glycosyltransferase involved in cell wall biosynthesis